MSSGFLQDNCKTDGRGTKEDRESPTINMSENESAFNGETVTFGTSRRIEMPPAFLFPETETPPADLLALADGSDQVDRVGLSIVDDLSSEENTRISSDRSSEESTDVETKNNINKEQTGRL